MGEAGVRRVERAFSVDVVAGRLLTAYERCVAGRHRVRGPRRGVMGVLRGRDIVCVSSLDWDAHWTSKQQIMHRLGGDEPHPLRRGAGHHARAPQGARLWRRWRALIPRMRRVEPGLWTLTPPPLLPFGNMRPVVNRLNQWWLARYVRWAARRAGLP